MKPNMQVAIRLFAEHIKCLISLRLQTLKQSLLHSLFPSTCLFCHTVMKHDEQGCCGQCLLNIHTFPLDYCHLCGTPMPKSLAPGPCGSCLQHKPAQCFTSSLFTYQGAVREALLAWKLQGNDAAMRWLLHTAFDRLGTYIKADDVLIPVPMPLSRMRAKSRHHGADLCRIMAADLGCAWDWQVLRRVGEQPRQSSLPASERRRNLCKAFKVDIDYWQQQDRAYHRIWLIDDIITTGATVHYAAKALSVLDKKVSVLSLARSI